MAATLAGQSRHGKVAAQEQGTASALLTASRQCGSAIGVAVLSAVLVVTSGSDARRTAIGLLVAACFALAGLAATPAAARCPRSRRKAAGRTQVPAPCRRHPLSPRRATCQRCRSEPTGAVSHGAIVEFVPGLVVRVSSVNGHLVRPDGSVRAPS